MEKLGQLGPGIFLDLKFHDIPNTVKGAVASAVALPGIELLDLHALGGQEMMRAAAKARDDAQTSASAPKLLAITILTSMDNLALRRVGITPPASQRVPQLARLAKKAGMDGVVASPQEIRAIRRACGREFLIVVPGIRPTTGGGPSSGRKKYKTDDQARVATPSEAIRAGADYLVIGRPITAAPDPVAATRAILDEINLALQ